ncbi:MAG: hypothetical protein HY862_17800 [Chloroflexi bacterium]|nr:hypothetical protein [Chloroflexota bacterium]
MSEINSDPKTDRADEDLIYEPGLRHKSHTAVYTVIGLLGLAIGVGLGLFYTWQLNPVIERNTGPDKLREEDKINYVIGVGLDYAHTGDLNRAYNLLAEVEPGSDPFQIAADTVCTLTRQGRIQTSADIQAIRNLIAVFQGQPDVQANCDLDVFTISDTPTPTPQVIIVSPTPTPPLIATKTATPESPVVVETIPVGADATAPSIEGRMQVAAQRQFCDANNPGMIEIYVQEETSVQIPGVPIEVRWAGTNGQQSQIFYTGLKPQIGPGYADFKMTPGVTYIVSLPDFGATTERLVARTDACDNGVTISYEIYFRPIIQ